MAENTTNAPERPKRPSGSTQKIRQRVEDYVRLLLGRMKPGESVKIEKVDK